jgi:hypothetical protein
MTIGQVLRREAATTVVLLQRLLSEEDAEITAHLPYRGVPQLETPQHPLR